LPALFFPNIPGQRQGVDRNLLLLHSETIQFLGVSICGESSAKLIPHPTFCYRISNVICLGPLEEMLRTNTRWIVTAMANLHSFFQRTKGKFVNGPMDVRSFAINMKISVSMFPDTSFPNPAITVWSQPRAFVYALPNSLCYGFD
jgi:hypothetical protein